MSTDYYKHFIDASILKEAQAHAQTHKQPLVLSLITEYGFDETTLAKSLAEHLQIPYCDIISQKTTPLGHPDFCKKHMALPFFENSMQIKVAIATPEGLAALDILRFKTGKHVLPYLTAYLSLAKKIHQLMATPTDTQTPGHAPLDEMMTYAIHNNASDIHMEAEQFDYRIRCRINGKLYSYKKISRPLAQKMITQIKLKAQCDITQTRLPQDGQFTFHTSKKISKNCRLSTCPSTHGEKIVIRLLSSEKEKLSIDYLGFSKTQADIFLHAIHQTQGLILVTGPTGSGKSLTLYNALHHLNSGERNIQTIEDPVEMSLPGITQVNVNRGIGLDFTKALRSFLRQDPDIIMIGEIRDTETAQIALKASQTGHLVLSTLHTNGTIETWRRLQHLGISEFDLFESISLIIAQRLVRKLCSYCKTPNNKPINLTETPTGEDFIPVGCDRCHQGYSGRMALFEMLQVTDQTIQTKKELQQARGLTLQAQAKKQLHKGQISYHDNRHLFQ